MTVYLLIFITTACTIIGQLILKRAMVGLRPLQAHGIPEFLFGAALSPLVWAALALQVLGYVVWFYVISREKLSVAFALSGAMAYVLMAFASWLVYDERLGGLQWLGLVLISVGVVLMTTQGRSPALA